MKRARKADLIERLVNFIQDFGIYAMAVVGVFLSHYWPQIKATGLIHLSSLSWDRAVSSIILAFIVLFFLDLKEDTEANRKVWKKRAGIALMAGLAWQSLFN